MKKIEKVMVEKISKAPLVWMFNIVAFFGVLCWVGVGIKTFATSMGMAVFGLVLSIISFIGMYLLVRFFIKHDLARNIQ
ncbi:hypothetical protein A7M79_00605 [Acinetobacter baumannii]|uniref:hypothetical protein n=1 Tax=Acinetobacter baumannii TaxID=470 RepID=UPI0008DD52B4|nr:hypothetical protein [Acinetobacter baumannii]OIH12024.1 hypothetical protein A7M79_00605 [Acinetobacter baumannii]